MIRDFVRVTGSLTVFFLFASCGSDGGPANPGSTPPHTPDEALSQLTQQNRQAFESWKSRIVKACDASEAFGISDSADPSAGDVERGIDSAVLIQNNNHSLIVSGSAGDFVILGGANSFGGVATSNVDLIESVNDQSYQIKAETKRDGSTCTVLLYGQKVYETEVAHSLDITAYWDGSAAAQLTHAQTVIQAHASSGITEVPQNGIFESLKDALGSNKKAIPLLASRFGIDQGTAAQLFTFNNYLLSSSIRLTGDPAALWFSADNQSIVGSSSVLSKLFDGSAQSAQLDWRIPLPRISYGSESNSADHGELKASATIEIAGTQGNPQSFDYQVKSMTLNGQIPFDGTEASECVRSRTRTLHAIANVDPVPANVLPSVQDAINSCGALNDNTEALVYSNGTLKSLVSELVLGIVRGPDTKYNGWDTAISKLALDDLAKGIDIRSDLDPSGRVPLFHDISDYLMALNGDLQKASNLSSNGDVVYPMGLTWAFTGQQVMASRISQIVNAADNAISPFRYSTVALLNDLALAPASNDDTLAFAMSLDSAYKAEANRALNLAHDVDYTEWERDYFSQILQKKVPLADLQDWSARLQRIKTEIVKYPNLNAFRGSLVALAIKWTGSGEANLDQTAKIYASLSNALDPFQDSTSQLIQSLSNSPLAASQPALDFAATLTPEYKQIAMSIRDTQVPGFEDWGNDVFKSVLQKRPSQELLRASLGTLQASLQFTQREQARLQGDSDFLNEVYRKSLISTALNESWSNQDFLSLEQIAQLGKFKNVCGDYKGVSSTVNCIGTTAFSRQAKKFLDPSYGDRYGALSAEFVNYMNTLPEADYFTLRNSLMTSFFSGFSPIWASCSDSDYRPKASTLRSQMSAIVVETDFMKKSELERAIDETLKDCTASNP